MTKYGKINLIDLDFYIKQYDNEYEKLKNYFLPKSEFESIADYNKREKEGQKKKNEIVASLVQRNKLILGKEKESSPCILKINPIEAELFKRYKSYVNTEATLELSNDLATYEIKDAKISHPILDKTYFVKFSDGKESQIDTYLNSATDSFYIYRQYKELMHKYSDNKGLDKRSVYNEDLLHEYAQLSSAFNIYYQRYINDIKNIRSKEKKYEAFDAIELSYNLKINQLNANAKQQYLNKSINIIGTITSITSGLNVNIYPFVKCKFNSENSINKLKPFDRVKINGTVTGTRVGKNGIVVYLSNCKVVNDKNLKKYYDKKKKLKKDLLEKFGHQLKAELEELKIHCKNTLTNKGKYFLSKTNYFEAVKRFEIVKLIDKYDKENIKLLKSSRKKLIQGD